VTPIKFLTIHCAATPEGRDVHPETVAGWDIAKFGQESYHWIVTLDGKAHRRMADQTKGAHVGGANTGNIGVCYIGGMDAQMKAPKDTRTAEQTKALTTLVRTYRDRYPGIVIRGHNEWPGVSKACPSFDVSEWLKTL
jgi:N-acetylmuramoyl-L-alanine amidase